jgi:arsenate reductase
MGARAVKRPSTVLFICYGNACRSPMAEAIGRLLLPGVEVRSAGVVPLGFIPAETTEMLREAGIEASGLASKPADDDALRGVDVAIDLCGDFVAPASFRGECETWPVVDPYRRPLAVWRAVRDDLVARISVFAAARGFAARAGTPGPAPKDGPLG